MCDLRLASSFSVISTDRKKCDHTTLREMRSLLLTENIPRMSADHESFQFLQAILRFGSHVLHVNGDVKY